MMLNQLEREEKRRKEKEEYKRFVLLCYLLFIAIGLLLEILFHCQ